MPQLEDSFLHKGRRRAMCARLAERGITDPAVLAAMEKVPRHWFVDPTVEEHAYDDQALPIGCAQTISQPSTVAFQTQLLELKRGMKVLEIGTGSGYQTAVLCTLGARVFTIERQKALFDSTKQLLYDLHYHARCFLGDGYKGTPRWTTPPLTASSSPAVPPMCPPLSWNSSSLVASWSYRSATTIRKCCASSSPATTAKNLLWRPTATAALYPC